MEKLDEDRELLELTVADIAAAFAELAAQGWHVSPAATILALSRALAHLALVQVQLHPEQRSVILSTLRSVADCVEIESAVKH